MPIDERLLYRLLGARIRDARQRVHPRLSQAQLAERVGLSRASVVNIEAGRQHPPLHLLWQIAEALGTELNRLVPDQGEYAARIGPSGFSEHIVAQIEAEADGDPDTVRQLTEFVKRATTRG